jgi:hypothetical protein
MKIRITKNVMKTWLICMALILATPKTQAQLAKEIILNYINAQAKENSIDPKDFA